MHNAYLAHTPKERQQMLEAAGYTHIDDLFAPVPEALRHPIINLPEPLSEMELQQELGRIARKNTHADEQLCFLGAGAYRHYVPAVLSTLAGRSEFLTAYTPYQAEVSQGTLQVIYEFQSALCTLTGMDISNASTYEGATAAVEAMTMAARITGRLDLLVSDTVHPEYREVMKTYAKALDLPLHEGQGFEDVEAPAALVIQYPNFLGQIEDLQAKADWIHAKGGLLVVIMNDPVALGMLEAPGNLGADIVAGEAQAFGNSVSYGGPFLGFLTAREKYIRQMPGRMSGLAEDAEGKTAYTLVLQTREQHIRREKATSNICTNQGLNALIATIWLSLIGKAGLQELAEICFQRAHHLAQRIVQLPQWSMAYEGPFFHEFVLKYEGDLTEVLATLARQNCIPGVALEQWYPELKNHLLVTVTEMNTVQDLEHLLQILEQVA
jgi:glycine dehydrogenase subunit 1